LKCHTGDGASNSDTGCGAVWFAAVSHHYYYYLLTRVMTSGEDGCRPRCEIKWA